MKFFGHIDLNNNEIQKAALEDEQDFPASPPLGRVIFREKRVFIAAELDGGDPVWVPITNTINTHVHRQETSSTTWTVNHNLNSATPLVTVYSNSNDKMFIPDDITVIDNNTIQVDLSLGDTGRCVVMSGELTGSAQPAYSFVYEQTTAVVSWVVTHGLGYQPLVRVFIGNQEVQPDTITHDSINQTTITFATPQNGVVRFI